MASSNKKEKKLRILRFEDGHLELGTERTGGATGGNTKQLRNGRDGEKAWVTKMGKKFRGQVIPNHIGGGNCNRNTHVRSWGCIHVANKQGVAVRGD